MHGLLVRPQAGCEFPMADESSSSSHSWTDGARTTGYDRICWRMFMLLLFVCLPVALIGQSTMTSPTAGSTFASASQTFTWTTTTGASYYQVLAGTTGAGSYNVADSGHVTATSLTINSMPINGATVYVRLYTELNGSLLSIDYTYTAVTLTAATLKSPTPGSTFASASETFTWTTATGATDYALFLGSTGPGSYNLYDSGNLTGTSLAVSALPINGETIYARLYTKFGGSVVYADCTFTAATLTQAALTSPTPGSALAGASETFTWTTAKSATNYALFLGSTGPGSYNLYDSGNLAGTSLGVSDLPVNGETIYARLYTKFGGTVVYADYTYTAATLTQAALTSPKPGSTFASASETFTWTTAMGATNYALFLGSTGPGSYNLYYSGNVTGTSLAVSDLPINGETIYARLYTKFGGTAVYTDYTYTAATLTQSALTSPTPGSALASASETFTWTTATGATNYALFLGSTGPGSYNLYDSGRVTATSITVNELPVNGEKIYATLYTWFNSTVVSNAYTYTSALSALSINVSSVGFGNVVLNTPTSQAVILTSTGNVAVTVNSASITGTGYTLTAPTLPAVLTTGQKVTLGVQFDPTTTGLANGQLTVNSTSSTGGTALIPLSGTGIVASYAVNLSWDAPTSSPDPVAGYEVYRAPSGSTMYQLLNSSVETATNYSDTTVEDGLSYDYIVESVDASGNESAPTSPVAVSIP